MHESQEPKKGVGTGETVEFLPLTHTCQGDCLLLSPLRMPDLLITFSTTHSKKTNRSPARKLTFGATRYGMGRVYGASAFNPLLGFQDIYL